jgi:hypothetical protein
VRARDLGNVVGVAVKALLVPGSMVPGSRRGELGTIAVGAEASRSGQPAADGVSSD